MKSSFFMVFALMALMALGTITLTHGQGTNLPNCNAFGVDLSPLSFDISLNTSTPTNAGWLFVVHPCGVITDQWCLNDTTSRNAMVCQRGQPGSNAYSLSDWNSSSVVYSRDVGGIYQQLITGELCGSTPRQSVIYYQCDPTATTPQFVSGAETSTCVYNFVIKTNRTCTLTHPQPCVFDGVDLNPMFAQGDLNFTNNYNWYVRMCASSTSNLRCANDSTSNTSMVCQQRLDGSDSFGIAIYNESNIQWQIIPTGNNAGLLMTVPNGEYCAAVSRNRIARLQMICDPTLGPGSSYIYGVAEVSTCTYQFTIRTSLSCSVVQIGSSTGPGISLSSSWWPDTTGSCTFQGYNLSPLMFNPDLYWGGFINNVYYDFYYHMCGYVRNRQCMGDSSTYNSMLCQASITNAVDNYGLDYFVPSNWNWTVTQYGARYTSQLGERCGSTRRTTTVNFICDLGADRIINIVQDPATQCNMNVDIKTRHVCNPDLSNLPPQPPECVYNGWDFKALTPRMDQDLLMFVNGSTNYTISLHMCNAVAYQACKRDASATKSMVCQTRSTDLQSYSLGDYAPNTQNWTENAATQTITMVVGGGELCGSNPRRTVVDFKCDLDYQARTGNGTAAILFNETSTCVYNLVIVYNDLVCAYFNGSNFNLTRSSSSSSTGPSVIVSSSSSTAANNDGCLSGSSIPDGAIQYSIVLNGPVSSLPPNVSAGVLQALTTALNVPSNQLACGTITAGTRIASLPNATVSQSIFTFYILPGASNVTQVAQTLTNIITTNPSSLNLPSNVPPAVQNLYQVTACPDGQYPDNDGICQPKPDDDSSSSLSDGEIAGIVVGSVVGGLLLIALAVCLIMRGRKSGSEGKGLEMSSR